MCRVLGVCRSSYYDWLNMPASPSKLEKKRLMEQIKMIFDESRKTYGTRRIQRVLVKKAILISRRRIKKLMNEQGLMVKTKKKFKATTDSNHKLPISDNILNRNFSVELILKKAGYI
jgi:putative transposase